jgi:hypothetical protein
MDELMLSYDCRKSMEDRLKNDIVIYNSWKRDRKEKDLILNQIDKKSWVYDVKPC